MDDGRECESSSVKDKQSLRLPLAGRTAVTGLASMALLLMFLLLVVLMLLHGVFGNASQDGTTDGTEDAVVVSLVAGDTAS